MSVVRHVILVTDGDKYAKEAVERTAKDMGLRCISQSAGNPTQLTGQAIVNLILQTPFDPVLVMFDDCGFNGKGPGEKAMEYVARHPDIQPLGAVAVASHSGFNEWSRVDVSIDQNGELTPYGVDKNGVADLEIGRIAGDTVYSLDRLQLPVVVGVGDIGKIYGVDAAIAGAPITKAAIQLILERSGYHASKSGKRQGTDKEEN
ncbi:stage V sporulation protein AE [Pullulanibacillus pueri]|uniref:stage V sporulation protein AE n=1 Tax=Pullulanibacillus pueri TaxID=1437324 RepID=UPI00166640B9|nr:stage V sporulation protein AE [Pullulanibacillus pueri]